MIYPKEKITGAILAGGKGSRMGHNDKGLITLHGIPLIEHVIAKVSPQVGSIMINANRNLEDYKKYGVPVVSDLHPGLPGPLAGIAASLSAAKTPLIATVPCDSPFLPDDLIARLYESLMDADADLAIAHSKRLQPVFSLGKRTLLDNLNKFLEQGEGKIEKWHEGINTVQTDFGDCFDSFVNINSPEELNSMEKENSPA